MTCLQVENNQALSVNIEKARVPGVVLGADETVALVFSSRYLAVMIKTLLSIVSLLFVLSLASCASVHKVDPFEECVAAGNPVSKSLPAQCRNAAGEVFTASSGASECKAGCSHCAKKKSAMSCDSCPHCKDKAQSCQKASHGCGTATCGSACKKDSASCDAKKGKCQACAGKGSCSNKGN